jgi:hypothetical protein
MIYLLVYLILSAGGHKILTGTVFDAASKDPLPTANIVVAGTEMGTTSDYNGFYSIILPDTLKKVKLVCSMMGYKKVEREIFFFGKDYAETDIAMRITTLKSQGILISAKRKKFRESAAITPASLSTEDLLILPSFQEGDVMRTLEALPGITKASDYSTDIAVRGGSPDQNLVLLDNIPLLRPFHLSGIFSAFNVNAIKNVELYKSGIPAEYDAALSSVLDVKTKGVDRDIKGLNGVFSLGLLSAGATIGSPLPYLNTNFLFTVRRTYFDKIIPDIMPYYFYDGYLHIESDITDNWTAVLSGFKSKDFLDIRDENNEEIQFVGLDWDNNIVGLNMFHSGDNESFLHFSGGFSKHSFHFSLMDTIFITNGVIDISTLGIDYSRAFGGHKLKFGINDEYRPFKYDISSNMGVNFEYEDIWSNRAMGFAEDEFSPVEDLLIRGGLALTHYYSESEEFEQNNSAFFRSYRLSAKYFLNEIKALTVSLGNYHQFEVPLVPGESETGGMSLPFYYLIPLGGEYNPEEAHHINLGYEGWLNESYYFSLEGYYRIYNRLYKINEDPETDIENASDYYRTMFDEKEGDAYGMDFLLKKEIGKLRGWLSYTFLKSRIKSGDESYPSVWDRTHNLYLILFTMLPKEWELGVQFAFSTGNPFTMSMGRYYYRKPGTPYDNDNTSWWMELEGEKNAFRLPSYLRLDISATKTFYFGNNEGDLKLSLYNALNRKNVWFYYYDYDEEPPLRETFNMLPIVPSIEFIYRF